MLTESQLLLWEKLKAFEISDPEAGYSFSDRLSRENGWSVSFSLRAIYEYKKFVFLIHIAPHPLTPSDQVDQVWHLHLLYTESYWKDLCGNILGREIHHGPTKGGQQERDKYENWYERTLAFYRDTFDRLPPVDIWPASEARFRDINFQRVDMDKYMIIRKPIRWK